MHDYRLQDALFNVAMILFNFNYPINRVIQFTCTYVQRAHATSSRFHLQFHRPSSWPAEQSLGLDSPEYSVALFSL